MWNHYFVSWTSWIGSSIEVVKSWNFTICFKIFLWVPSILEEKKSWKCQIKICKTCFVVNRIRMKNFLVGLENYRAYDRNKFLPILNPKTIRLWKLNTKSLNWPISKISPNSAVKFATYGSTVTSAVWFIRSSTFKISWRIYGDAKTIPPQTAGIINAKKWLIIWFWTLTDSRNQGSPNPRTYRFELIRDCCKFFGFGSVRLWILASGSPDLPIK